MKHTFSFFFLIITREKSIFDNFDFFQSKCDRLSFFLNSRPLSHISLEHFRRRATSVVEMKRSLFLMYGNSEENSNFDAGIRMADDKSRARVSFIGTPAGVILAVNPPEFTDNFGETSQPRGTYGCLSFLRVLVLRIVN